MEGVEILDTVYCEFSFPSLGSNLQSTNNDMRMYIENAYNTIKELFFVVYLFVKSSISVRSLFNALSIPFLDHGKL